MTDEQWSAVSPRIPQQRGPQSERANRNFIDAVVWLATTGAPWRDLDASFGPWKTVYNRFRNWALCGWWKQLFRGTPIEEKVGSILDASIVRAHQDAAGGRGGPAANALGRSRGGFSTKLHAVVTLERYRVEVFCHRLKRYRRIATPYDKTSTCFMGFVYVICALMTFA